MRLSFLLAVTLATEWSIERWTGYTARWSPDLGWVLFLWMAHERSLIATMGMGGLLVAARGLGSASSVAPIAASLFASLAIFVLYRSRVNLHELAFRAFWLLPPFLVHVSVSNYLTEGSVGSYSELGLALGVAFLSAILFLPILDAVGLRHSRRAL